jgi:hypothetical protein
METKNSSNSPTKFECEICDYRCSKINDYTKHLLTRKHLKLTNGDEKVAQKEFICDYCEKIYISRNGLWKHKKTCKPQEPADEKEMFGLLLKDNTEFKNLVLEVMKNNTELQKQNHELQKQNQDLNKQVLDVYIHKQPVHINSHNNSHNKTFNLQFFLNEQCKDAMNIMDFVNSVTLQLSDLESVGKLGYVEGISNIMIKKLNEMDIYKRPVHCSDAKRETLYVKDNNIWEKENATHSKLRRAIKYISKKNSDLLLTWSNQHPASKNIHSKQNEEYMKMIYQAMGGVGDVEENENKIIKKISKMVLIEK